MAEFFFFEHAEGFAGEVALLAAAAVGLLVQRIGHLFGRVEDIFEFFFRQVGRVEDVAELFARKAVEPGVVGVQFGAQPGAAGGASRRVW